MSKKGADDVIETTNHPFSSSILLRRLWTGKAEHKTVRVGKGFKFFIIEFTTKITVECFNSTVKLSLNEFMKLFKVKKCV